MNIIKNLVEKSVVDKNFLDALIAISFLDKDIKNNFKDKTTSRINLSFDKKKLTDKNKVSASFVYEYLIEKLKKEINPFDEFDDLELQLGLIKNCDYYESGVNRLNSNIFNPKSLGFNYNLQSANRKLESFQKNDSFVIQFNGEITLFDFLIVKLNENFKALYSVSKQEIGKGKKEALKRFNKDELIEFQNATIDSLDWLLKNNGLTNNEFIWNKLVLGKTTVTDSKAVLFFLALNDNLLKHNEDKLLTLFNELGDFTNSSKKLFADKDVWDLIYKDEKRVFVKKLFKSLSNNDLKFLESECIDSIKNQKDYHKKVNGSLVIDLVLEMYSRKIKINSEDKNLYLESILNWENKGLQRFNNQELNELKIVINKEFNDIDFMKLEQNLLHDKSKNSIISNLFFSTDRKINNAYVISRSIDMILAKNSNSEAISNKILQNINLENKETLIQVVALVAKSKTKFKTLLPYIINGIDKTTLAKIVSMNTKLMEDLGPMYESIKLDETLNSKLDISAKDKVKMKI